MTYIDSKGQQITRLQAVEYLSEFHVQEMEKGIRGLYMSGKLDKEEIMVFGTLCSDGVVRDVIEEQPISTNVFVFDVLDIILSSVIIFFALLTLGLIGISILITTNAVSPHLFSSAWVVMVYYFSIVALCMFILTFGAKMILKLFWRNL